MELHAFINMNGKAMVRFLAIALITGCQALLLQCGASPVVVPADLIDTTGGVLSGDPYPRVSSVQPIDGAANVPLNTNYVIIFSLPVNATTLQSGISVSSSSLGPLLYGTLNQYTIAPTAGTTTSAVIHFNALIPINDTISVTIGSSITSLGQPINNPGTHIFTVMGAGGLPDTTPPTALTGTESPANTAINVPLASVISISFTEASGLDYSSINPHTFYITDTLTNIIPCVRTISGSSPTWTVTLNPAQPLLPGRIYTVTIDSAKVRDLSGNPVGGLPIPWSFTTINSDPYAFGPNFEAGFPRVDVVETSGTAATVSWDTNKPVSSVFHYGRDNNNPPTGGTISNANFITSGLASIAGLTAGKQYYYRTDITDISPGTTLSPIGTFITPTVEIPVAVIAPPTLTNQTIAYAGERTRSGVNPSGAFIVWSDFNGVHNSLHGQLYDNSFTAQWGAGVGANLFTDPGNDYTYLSSAEDFEGDFILLASRNGVGIYAKRITAAGGIFNWGAASNSVLPADPGLQISAAGSHAWAVPVYTGMFTNVTNGTTTMNYSSTLYLYDPGDDFSLGSAVSTNDIVMDTAAHSGTTVTTTNFRYILDQAAANISTGDQYRIADGNAQFQNGISANDHTMFDTTTYTSGSAGVPPTSMIYTNHAASPLPGWLANNDIIKSVASGLYGQVSAFTTISPQTYESNAMTRLTQHLFDGSGTPFSSALIGNGDLAKNTTTPAYAHVNSRISSNDLALDADIFPNTGDGYAVYNNIDSGAAGGTALIPNRMVKSTAVPVSAGYFVYNTSLSPLSSNLATVSSVNSNTEVVLNVNEFGAASNPYQIWDNAAEFSGTASATVATHLYCSAKNFGTIAAGDLVHNTASGTYTRVAPGPIVTTTTNPNDTVLLNFDIFTSGQSFIIYHLVDSGNAGGVALNRIYKSGASWTVSIGDVVENTTTHVFATVTAAGAGVNELQLSSSIFSSTSDGYAVYNRLSTATSQSFLGNHLTRAGAGWGAGQVGYLVNNTVWSTFGTVSNWVTSTDLLLNTTLFTAIGENYTMYSDYCSTHVPSLQPFGSITADWGINITAANTFNLYHYRGHTGTATVLPANPLFANAANFAGVVANDLAFNFTSPFGAPNPNYGPVVSIPNSSALSLANAVFADAQIFYILRYPINLYGVDPTLIRTHGTTTSVLAGHCMDTANSFATVSAGDYLYDISTQTYALITGVAVNNLTLSPTTFSMALNNRYVVVRQRNVLYVWQNAPNIVGRVMTYDKIGVATTIPTDVHGSLGSPFTIVANAQNPYAFSDEAGGSILVYENIATGQIVVQLLNGLGNPGASILADNAHASQTITKAIPDGHGGVVILYKYNALASLAAQWVQNNSGALSTATWGAGGSFIVTASTTDEDFAFNYNAGTPYVVAVWAQTNDIYARRVGFGGWATLTVCNDPSIQDKPHIYLNGANTLVTWEDRRWTNLIGYGIYGMKINDASGAKDGTWHADSPTATDFNGIPFMMNKYNKNSVNNLIVPFNRIGPALPSNMRLIWEDTRNKTTQAIDILSYDVTAIVP